MAINITKTETGFSIKFPFELKDNFKSCFKSAKWDSLGKVWTVGPRSGKRLEEWAGKVAPAVEALDAADEESLREADIEAVELCIAEIRAGIARARSERTTLEATGKTLADAKAELESVTAELETERAAATAAGREAHKALKAACDMNAVAEAHRVMTANALKSGRAAREAYREAQGSIGRQRENLANAGLRSSGLDKLYYCNFNRPDRDNPRDVKRVDLYTITAVDPED